MTAREWIRASQAILFEASIMPACVGLANLSQLTGLSRNTVSQHLRRGLRRILRESLM